MASTTNLNISIDTDMKARAEDLFNEMGMSLTTAINIFIRQSLRERCIPFGITLNTPGTDTIEAMAEAERIARDSSIKGFTDIDSLMADLNS